jgi:hypothetical protein
MTQLFQQSSLIKPVLQSAKNNFHLLCGPRFFIYMSDDDDDEGPGL